MRTTSFLIVCIVAFMATPAASSPYCPAPPAPRQSIIVKPPSSLQPSISNLGSENFDLGYDDEGFVGGSVLGNLFHINCSGNTNQLTAFNQTKVVTGVKFNPYDGLLYALFTNFPPIYNSQNQSYIGIFEPENDTLLDTFDLTPYSDISKGCLANDMAFLDGIVYITDSLSSRIYALDTDTGVVSVYSSSSLYVGTPSSLVGGLPIGLEGLFRPEGADYMVASKFSDGSGANPGAILVKIPDANPGSPKLIKVQGLTETLDGGLDGLFYDYENCLLYGANAQGYVFRIYSNDDWDSAVIGAIAPIPQVRFDSALGPTVSVVLAPTGDIYALNAGGFNPKQTGTISVVNFRTSPSDHCPSTHRK